MNYSKISGQIVCKTVVLLAFMFAACSEDAGQSPLAHDGGYTEETASLDNIKMVAQARRFVSEDDGSSHANKLVSSVPPGSLLRMRELDSVDFTWTDEVYFSRSEDSTGVFNFDSISLKSPYVLIDFTDDCQYGEDYEPAVRKQLMEQCETFWKANGSGKTNRVLVDVRKSKNVSVNVVTEMVTSRLLYLMSQGEGYEDAKLQSEREMLNVLGIYGVPYRFDMAISDENRAEILFADYLNAWLDNRRNPRSLAGVVGTFAKVGSLNEFAEAEASDQESVIKKMLVAYVEDWSHSEWVDDDTKKYLYDIVHNFMASLYDLGPCSAENDGDSATRPYDDHRDIIFACKTGVWSYSVAYAVPDSVGAVLGQMTDSRDGTKYKTVTYNIGGESQTWLAENLKYESADGLYYWSEAMNLPDSVALVTYEECLEENLYAYCDKMQPEKWNFAYERLWNITDSVKAAGKTYQGVCPDGWHLPDANEWKTLREYVEEKIDIASLQYGDVMSIAGFGDPDPESKGLFVIKIDRAAQDIRESSDKLSPSYILLKISSVGWTYLSLEGRSPLKSDLIQRQIFAQKALSVRCVKD